MTKGAVLANQTIVTRFDEKNIHACLKAIYEYASKLDNVESIQLDIDSGEPLLILEGEFGEILISEGNSSETDQSRTIAVSILDEDGEPQGKTKQFRFDQSRDELFNHILKCVNSL